MTNSNTNKLISNKPYSIHLYKSNICYNPLSIIYRNKEYLLNNIHFYDKDDVIISTYKGWFGRYSFKVSLPISKDLTLKRKKDFSKNEPFIIKSANTNEYELYLPISDFNISRKYKKTTDMIIADYSFTANNNIECSWSNCVKTLGLDLLKLKQNYESLIKKINIEDTEINFLNNLEELKSKFYAYKKLDTKQKEYPTMDMKYYNN